MSERRGLERFSPLWFALMLAPWALWLGWTLLRRAEDGPAARQVVVYCALDRLYAQPILDAFQAETGISVLAKWDTEATKTVGLVQAIRAERDPVRCDVFWNNELMHTIALAREGLLEPYRSPAAEGLPDWARDPEGRWTAFAARARVLLASREAAARSGRAIPRTAQGLLDPALAGQVGIAKPLFGTTATHVAALFALDGPAAAKEHLLALRRNRVVVCASNADTMQRVKRGELLVAWTDSDDANLALEAGAPVEVVFPDQGPEGRGTLVIPNSLAIVRGGPNAAAARALVDYLLSARVEAALSAARGAQIPLRPGTARRPWIPADLKVLPVSWPAVADQLAPARAFVEEAFLPR